MSFLLSCLTILFIHVSAFSQKDTLHVSSPYDSLFIEQTTLGQWKGKHGDPHLSGAGEKSTMVYFNGAMKTYYGYVICYDNNYSVKFTSVNDDLKNERPLDFIRFSYPNEVVFNSHIRIGKSSSQQVQRLFGEPISKKHIKNCDAYKYVYERVFNGHTRKIIMVFRQNALLSDVMICSVDTDELDDTCICFNCIP